MRVVFGDPGGDISQQLQPLAGVIANAPSDDALLDRLRPGSAAVAVAKVIRQTGRPLTHDLLDQLPTDASMHWLRNALTSPAYCPTETST